MHKVKNSFTVQSSHHSVSHNSNKNKIQQNNSQKQLLNTKGTPKQGLKINSNTISADYF